MVSMPLTACEAGTAAIQFGGAETGPVSNNLFLHSNWSVAKAGLRPAVLSSATFVLCCRLSQVLSVKSVCVPVCWGVFCFDVDYTVSEFTIDFFFFFFF